MERDPGRPSLEDWLMRTEVHVTSSEEEFDEEEEDEGRRTSIYRHSDASCSGDEDEDKDEDEDEDNCNDSDHTPSKREGKKARRRKHTSGGFEDDDVSAWTGVTTWPRLDNPPFTSKNEPLILSKPGEPIKQVPAHIAKYLRQYQLEGVRFLYNHYSNDTGCILGDDMGLGKTTQTTAFLIAILGKSGTSADICTPLELSQKSARARPVMIACPASILNQWKSELLVWSFFIVCICHGLEKESVIEKAQHGELEIMIISYETYRTHSDTLSKIDWEVVVFDEAHRVKNRDSSLAMNAQKLRCRRRIGLTGTLLQNEMKELHCTLNWAAPGCLGELDHFREGYERPIKQGQRKDAKPHEILKSRKVAMHLKALIDKRVLRRDKRKISDQVPGKEDFIVVCPMSELQVAVYKRVVNSRDFLMMRSSQLQCDCNSGDPRGKCCCKEIPANDFEMFIPPDGKEILKWSYFLLPAIIQLCKISNHLDLIRVCQRDKQQKQTADRVFASRALNSDSPSVIEQDDRILKMCSDEDCGKLQVIRRLLAKFYQQNDKVLIFSYSVRMLNILERYIQTQGHTYLRLDGSTLPSKRLKIVDQYNCSKAHFIMLLSTKAGGLGINLTSANTVIIVDPNWNPSHDLQAQDRAYRIGQRRHVKVYRLLSAGTIEEVMYQRQIYKQQLVNMSMDASAERRYFTGVQGDNKELGELWGCENLLRWRPPTKGSVDTGRVLGKDNQDFRSLAPLDIQKDGRELSIKSVRAKKQEAGDDDDHDDDGWYYLAKDIVEEVEEGLQGGVESSKKANAEPLTVLDILERFALHTHKHDDIVGEDASEKAFSVKIKEILPTSKATDLEQSSKGKSVHQFSLDSFPEAKWQRVDEAGSSSKPAGESRRDAGASTQGADVQRDYDILAAKCKKMFGCTVEEFLAMLEDLDDENANKMLRAVAQEKIW